MTHIDHSKYKICNEFLHWQQLSSLQKNISEQSARSLITDIHIIRNASNEAENYIKNIKEELYNSENVAFLSLVWFGELLWKPLDCFLSLKKQTHTHTHTYPGTGSKPIGPVTLWKCWGRHCFYLSCRSQASQTGVQFHTINCLSDKQFLSSFMKINGILCVVGSHHSGLDHKNNFCVTQHMLKYVVCFDWFYT